MIKIYIWALLFVIQSCVADAIVENGRPMHLFYLILFLEDDI